MGDCARGDQRLSTLVHAGRKLLVLLPLLLFLGAAPAFAVDFSAYWQHRVSGGDEVETREFFQQRYGLGAGQGLSFRPTPVISANGNVGYTRSESDVGTGTVTSEEIAPSANLNVANDIFRTSLSGTTSETRRSQGTDLARNSWDAVLESSWERFLWPNMRLSYGESGERTDDLAAAGARDSKDSRYAFGLDWDLILAKFFYDFNSTQNEDLLTQSLNESDSHFARVETGGNFWQKRLNLRLTQQYEQTDSNFSGKHALEAGPVEAKVYDLNDLATPSPELVENEDTASLPLTMPADSRGHLFFSFGFGSDQQVDELYVSLVDGDNVPLDAALVGQLQWQLYVRGSDELPGTPWQQVAITGSQYNDRENRFELTVDPDEVADFRDFMLVVTNPTNDTVRITVLEVISQFTGKTKQTLHLTNASMRVLLTPTLSASSSMILEKAESESDDFSSEALRRSLNASLRWTPTPLVTPTLRYSETLQEEDGAPDALNRTYSLLVTTIPLPTLNVGLGATRSERFSDNSRISYSDNYSLTSTAKIYPDLTAGLNVNYVTSTRLQSDDTSTTSDTMSSRLALNARITPALTADLTTNYMQSQTATSSSTNSDSTLTLTYRPSDLLSMRLTGARRWTDSTSPDVLTYNLSMALLRTKITRVTFRYNRTQAEDTRDSFGLDGSWDISSSLALQTRLNYAIAETNTWNILTTLALRL